MSIRIELQAALDSWTSDGSEAFEIVEKIFARIRALLHAHLKNKSFDDVDLLIADLRRDTHEDLSDLIRNTVDRDAVVDIVASRFFGED